jgi:hypothetical protein
MIGGAFVALENALLDRVNSLLSGERIVQIVINRIHLLL